MSSKTTQTSQGIRPENLALVVRYQTLNSSVRPLSLSLSKVSDKRFNIPDLGMLDDVIPTFVQMMSKFQILIKHFPNLLICTLRHLLSQFSNIARITSAVNHSFVYFLSYVHPQLPDHSQVNIEVNIGQYWWAYVVPWVQHCHRKKNVHQRCCNVYLGLEKAHITFDLKWYQWKQKKRKIRCFKEPERKTLLRYLCICVRMAIMVT